MKRILKASTRVFLKKLAMSFVYFAMLFVIPLFEKIKYANMIYSFIICIFLYYWLWRDISSEGRKHIAKSQTPFVGLFIGLLSEVITIVMISLMFVFKNAAWAKILYFIYNLPHVGFIKPVGTILPLPNVGAIYFLPFVITTLFCAAAYFAGYKKIDFTASVTNKIIYKNESEDK